jgi:hypothetical protein
MTIIEVYKKYITVPTQWNELSGRQLLQVMDTLFLKGYPTELQILKLFKIVLNLNWWQFFRLQRQPDIIEEYLYLVGFLLQPQTGLTKNLLPVFKHQGVTYCGPDSEISNLRMNEFTFTEDHFIAWWEEMSQGKTNNTERLDELVAILYRPAKPGYNMKQNPDGDARQKYNQNICSYSAKKYISHWPMARKLAIAYWYGGCRQQLMESNPDVFGGSGGEASRYGLVSVMLNVAEDKVFGDFEKVEEQYVNLVLMQLNEMVDRSRRMEKESQSVVGSR